MSAIIQGLNAYVGLVSMLAVFGVAVISSRLMAKSNVGDATNKAQNDAIKAMQEEIASLRRKMDDITKDNIKLKRTIDTIRSALERRGLIVTISDDAIDIEDNKKSTTIRILNEDMQ